MTLSTTTSRVVYPGAGSAGPFAIPFRFTAAGDLRVTKRSSVGVETSLVSGTHFTTTGAGNATGTLTLTTALAAGETLSIRRAPALTQTTSIRNQGSYFPATIEDTFDRLVMQIQSLEDRLNGSVGLDESYDPAAYDLRLTPGTAGQVLGWQGGNLTNLAPPVSSGVVLPAQNRTVASLTAYLMNNALFNVTDYAPVGVVITDGAGDATSAINAAVTACKAAGGGIVYFPPGTYKTSSNITVVVGDPPMGVTLLGVFGATIIKPTAAVTICFNLGSSSSHPTFLSRLVMEGFRIDGTACGANAVGIKVGDDTITMPIAPYSTYVTFRNVESYSFTGAAAKAWWVADVVKGHFVNCYGGKSSTCMHIEAFLGSLPTALHFIDCDFRSATSYGVVIVTGFRIRFTKGVIEANNYEGVYIVPLLGQNVLGIEFDGVWFEGNQILGGAGQYHIRADGEFAGTVELKVTRSVFSDSCKSIYLKHVKNVVLDDIFPADLANSVFIDIGVNGTLRNWPHNNRAIATRYTNTLSPVGFRYQDLADDASTNAWTDWVPNYSANGPMTFTAVTTQKARYKLIGKTLFISVAFTGTTGGVANTAIYFELPPNMTSKDGVTVNGSYAYLNDGAVASGNAQQDGTAPTSIVVVGRTDGANWSLGAGRGARLNMAIELA